jgi:hypothetical protein
MTSISFRRLLQPVLFFAFIPVCILLIATRRMQAAAGLDFVVLFTGNALLFCITAIALYFHQKGMESKNPHAFFRAVYGSMILRMFFCIAVVVLYAVAAGDALNKYALLLCFVFYFLYSFLEVRRIFQLIKK